MSHEINFLQAQEELNEKLLPKIEKQIEKIYDYIEGKILEGNNLKHGNAHFHIKESEYYPKQIRQDIISKHRRFFNCVSASYPIEKDLSYNLMRNVFEKNCLIDMKRQVYFTLIENHYKFLDDIMELCKDKPYSFYPKPSSQTIGFYINFGSEGIQREELSELKETLYKVFTLLERTLNKTILDYQDMVINDKPFLIVEDTIQKEGKNILIVRFPFMMKKDVLTVEVSSEESSIQAKLKPDNLQLTNNILSYEDILNADRVDVLQYAENLFSNNPYYSSSYTSKLSKVYENFIKETANLKSNKKEGIYFLSEESQTTFSKETGFLDKTDLERIMDILSYCDEGSTYTNQLKKRLFS